MPDEDGNNSYDYKYCNQNYLSNPKNGEMAFEKFPAVGVENDRQYGNRNDDGWMSDDQYRVVRSGGAHCINIRVHTSFYCSFSPYIFFTLHMLLVKILRMG